MHLQIQTLKKFAREALLTVKPLTLNKTAIAALKKRLTAWFAGNDAFTMHWADERVNCQRIRSLCSFSASESERYYGYYTSFALGVNEQEQLHVALDYRTHHPVGNLDELLEFLRLCRERVTRIKGQQAKQVKIRKLRGAAILARVQELARTHCFDYASSESTINFTLTLRFDEQHVIELAIPFAKWEEMLPQIETALPLLRDLVRAGISTQLRPKYAGYARRLRWVLHKTLAANTGADLHE
jgi:hypothetical protein